MFKNIALKLQLKQNIKTIPKDNFIKRLYSSVIGEGMLHEGNIYLIDYAIKNMPKNGIVLEIGSYGGLSANLICHLLKSYNKQEISFISCDAWVYEGYNDHKKNKKQHIDGNPNISRLTFMNYIKNAYINSIQLLHPEMKPYACHLDSDTFFDKWENNAALIDVFNRTFKINKKIAFCYIDGDHSLEQTKKDFYNVSKNILKGGFILIDDSADYLNFGSAKFIKEIKQNNDYKIILKNPNYLIQKL